MPANISAEVDVVAAAERFSGVVRFDRDGAVELCRAYGLADRAHGLPNKVDTQFGIASGAKALTALAVVSLAADGTLPLDTPARSLLGCDLPLIDDQITVEHLLGHRSGIGDYLDEDGGGDILDYVMPVPVHRLSTTEEYLAVLDGHPPKFEPDKRFSYCNGGYVVLALLAERAAGRSFYDLVDERVCRPAGMHDTAFLRSDELPGRVALGYLHADGLRTNLLHLPVRGTGDGGVHTTAADVHALWSAFFAGRIVAEEWVQRMATPRSEDDTLGMRYGLGFWIHMNDDSTLMLEGYDAGVSFRTVCDRDRSVTHTVLANTTNGAWPVTRLLDELLAG